MLLRERVWEIMREEFPKVNKDVNLYKVMEVLAEHRQKSPEINCVLVFEQEKFIGLISMWNIIQSLGPCLLEEVGWFDSEVNWDKAFSRVCQLCSQEISITDLIQTDIPRVKPGDPLAKLMEIFIDYRRGRAIVEEGGKVLGIVLLSDLYQEIIRIAQITP